MTEFITHDLCVLESFLPTVTVDVQMEYTCIYSSTYGVIWEMYATLVVIKHCTPVLRGSATGTGIWGGVKMPITGRKQAFGFLIITLFYVIGCAPQAVPGELPTDSAMPSELAKPPTVTSLPSEATMPSPTPVPTKTSAPLTTVTSELSTPAETTVTATTSGQSDGHSYAPSISADGRWVAFQSEASNLVRNDTNGVSDIFVYDRQTGTTERVSVANDGAQGNGENFSPSISADGRWVIFWSFASNLVAGDTEMCGEETQAYNCADIFVRDRQGKTTERIRAVGRQGLGGGNHRLDISADGRWVVFYSWASDLVPEYPHDHWAVFVHDRQTGTTELVSTAADGSWSNGDSVAPSISADGRRVVFVSWASNLVKGDTNKEFDVFVYDRETGGIRRVSISSDGIEGDGESGLVQHQQGWSGGAVISADGRWVAFTSNASNLVTEDTNQCDNPITGPHNCYDVFVHDLEEGVTIRVSVAGNGTPSDGESHAPAISATRRWVAFVSSASNLVLGDTNECPRSTFAINCPDVFVHDLQTETTERISVSSDGAQANDISNAPSVSSDGRWVAFASSADNLTEDDLNGFKDIFVRDRLVGETERVSIGISK